MSVQEEVQTTMEQQEETIKQLKLENNILQDKVSEMEEEEVRLWGEITKLENLFSLEEIELKRLAEEEEAEKKAKEEEVVAATSTINGSNSVSFNATATAYADTPSCQGKWVGKTATGIKPRPGIIAVDPKVIKLGSIVRIDFPSPYEYMSGNYLAADTGGAIKGNKVDVFFEDPGALKAFGRRKVKITY